MTLLFVNISKAFDSIHRLKIEQILVVYGLPKETVAAIIMLYKNTKVKVRSPDGDRFLCRCAARGHTSPIPVYYLPSQMLRTSVDLMKENGFTLVKGKMQYIPGMNNYG